MIPFSLLDITGDNIFNSLDILVGMFNFLFWYSFYKVVIKRRVKDPKQELKDTNIKYITGRQILNELLEQEEKIGRPTNI